MKRKKYPDGKPFDKYLMRSSHLFNVEIQRVSIKKNVKFEATRVD